MSGLSEIKKRIEHLVLLKDKERYERGLDSLYKIAVKRPIAQLSNSEKISEINRIYRLKHHTWQAHFIKLGSYLFDKLINEVDKKYKTLYEVRELNSKGTNVLTYCKHPVNHMRKDGRCYAPNCSCVVHFAANAPRLLAVFLREKRRSSLKSRRANDFMTFVIGCESPEQYKTYLNAKCRDMFDNDVPIEDMSIDEIKPCSAYDLFCEVQALQCFHHKNNQLLFKTKDRASDFGFGERRYVNCAKRNDPCSEEHIQLLEDMVEFTESQKLYMRSLINEFFQRYLK